MMLTRRRFVEGAAAVAAAAPFAPGCANAQSNLFVRRSIGDLVRENSPIIESYRRGVAVMMQRPAGDKTSWWFQANIHGVDPVPPQFQNLERYWNKCRHGNYFFVSWHRMYLYFFERIMRKASGDPNFALPFWQYDDPQQASLPAPFLPTTEELYREDEERRDSSRVFDAREWALRRSNPLARAMRFQLIERQIIGLGMVASQVQSTLDLNQFSTAKPDQAALCFGGLQSREPSSNFGGLENAPHNLVHIGIGLDGDMTFRTTAARDPIFWLHHANIDRLWVKWTDPEIGRVPPVRDQTWMQEQFLFVDENGKDRYLTGAEILDTQFNLGYRYQDDPPRSAPLDLRAPARIALGGPEALPTTATRKAGGARPSPPPPPGVLGRAEGARLAERETFFPLSIAAATRELPAGGNMRVILRDIVAREGRPPYEVLIGTAAAGPAAAVSLGTLALFGGAGPSPHDRGGRNAIAFDAGLALWTLSLRRDFDFRHLRMIIVRRAFQQSTGGAFVPPDSDPPKIGAVELVRA